MGRRKDNPGLVAEMLEQLWSMPQNDFEAKYDSLSKGDKAKVAGAILRMEENWEIYNN